MGRYWKGSHTTHRLEYHVVITPKFRKRVLIGKITGILKKTIYEGCKMNGWWVSELSIQKDHVHMMIQISPSEPISDVVRKIKGATSRIIREGFPEIIEFIWGKSLWSEGYFAETVGKVDEEIIRRYIRNQ